MLLSEKVAYLRGLMDGLRIDQNTDEGKVMMGIFDLLEEMAYAIMDIEDEREEINNYISNIEEAICDKIGTSESCCDEDPSKDYVDESNQSLEDLKEEEVYQVECPSCNDSIYIDYDMISNGSMNCPNCSELLEFEDGEDYSDDNGEYIDK